MDEEGFITGAMDFVILSNIVEYALDNKGAVFIIAFAEGDSYECTWVNGEYVDNEEDVGSPAYEEWYELDFHVEKIIKQGPNKDPRYEYIAISEKRMPVRIVSNGVTLYESQQ